jgi:hypothetical protein
VGAAATSVLGLNDLVIALYGHDKTIRGQQQRSDFQHTLKRADSVKKQTINTAQSSGFNGGA